MARKRTVDRGRARSPGAAENKEARVKDKTFVLREAVLWVLLVCATVITYGPALAGGVLWDDDNHITRTELQPLDGLWRIWSDFRAAPQYYPLLHSAFWVEHRIWGDSVLGYHLINLAEHVIAAGLVVLLVRRLSLPGAWLAGFLFALHPVHVEAVAWISEQKSTLSAMFYLAAALTYLHFDRSRRRSHYFWALGFFLCAVLSKTVTATLPAVLLVIFWWQRGRVSWKSDVLPLIPWFAAGGAAGILTAWVERTLIGAKGAEFVLTVPQRILLAGRVIWFYLGKLVWPANLIFTYPHWTIDTRVWWQYLYPAGVVLLATGLLVLARWNRGPLAGFLIFAGTLVPALGFIDVYPFRYSYVADHFQYLASLGVIVPAAAAITWGAGRFRLGRDRSLAVAGVFLVITGSLSWRQSHIYQDAETLYRETLARNPESWMAHNNLGLILADLPGGLPQAVQEFEAARRIKPDAAEVHLSLGSGLAHLPGRLPDAIAEFQTALRLRPNYADAHYSLGTALAHTPGRLADAIAEYKAALRLEPNLAMAHLNLGNALVESGRLTEAIGEYQAVVRIRPDYAEAHYNLGSALAQMPGRQREAIGEFQTALAIRPDLEQAREAIAMLEADEH